MLLQEQTKTAEKPKERDYLSYSAVSLYQQCPLRFFFKYVQGLPETTVSASLVLGSAIHAAAQHHFEQKLAGSPVPSLDCLLEVFWDDWHLHDHQRILFGKTEDIDSVGKLADRMLRAFQQSDFANPAGTIIGVEEELRGQLVPGLPDLLARIDLLIETDDALVVHDLKTARSAWAAEHAADAASQLLLYSELVKPLANGKPLRLQFAVLTKTKIPAVMLHPITHDPKQVERTKAIVAKVWRAIQGRNFYPTPSAMNCPTCPYQTACRAWAG